MPAWLGELAQVPRTGGGESEHLFTQAWLRDQAGMLARVSWVLGRVEDRRLAGVLAFRRCVFSVVFHNRDDHSKNFSFRLDRNRNWKLAPGCDLTFCQGPGGEHHMDVHGEARSIGRSHVLRLADEQGIPKSEAAAMMGQVCEVAGRFAALDEDVPVRKASRQQLARLVAENRLRVG